MTEGIDMIVERSISLGNTLQLIVEIDHNLAQWQHEMQLHTVTTHILLLDELASLVETKFHDRTNIVARRDDGGADIFLSGCCGSVRSLFTLDRKIRLMVELPGGPNREIPVRAIYAQHAPLFDLGRDDIPATMVWQES